MNPGSGMEKLPDPGKASRIRNIDVNLVKRKQTNAADLLWQL
jgi:hypothetical protein